MSERKYNEEQYKEQQIEGNDLHNAADCNQMADESLVWNPNEAVYWRKLAKFGCNSFAVYVSSIVF